MAVQSLVNPDGSERHSISDAQIINGDVIKGIYEWFEPASVDSSSCFGVIFKDIRNSNSYQLDFDANTGAVVAERRIM